MGEVLLSSVSAELATKGLLYPLDTLKTRLQYLVLPKRAASSARTLPLVGDAWLGMKILLDATRSPHHSFIDPELSFRGRSGKMGQQQLRAVVNSLYRGCSSQLLGVVPIALVYMPTYEISKAAAHGTALESTPIAGVATGIVSAVVRVPVSVVKSRLQLGLHQTTAAAISHATKGGVSGLYVGFHATVAVDVAYAVCQFATLEQLRRVASARQVPHATNVPPPQSSRSDWSAADPTQLSARVNAAIGFSTGIISAVLTEPLDVVRTRLMTQRAVHAPHARGEGAFGYESLVHGLRKAVRSEGVLSLWKGLLPRLLTKGLGSLIWYTSYMECRRMYAACARTSLHPLHRR